MGVGSNGGLENLKLVTHEEYGLAVDVKVNAGKHIDHAAEKTSKSKSSTNFLDYLSACDFRVEVRVDNNNLEVDDLRSNYLRGALSYFEVSKSKLESRWSRSWSR